MKIVPFIDRSDLVHFTTHTVLHNLGEGFVLVVIVLMLFLGNVRGALIVALTIPFSLLFASILLQARHIPANLLSLGALDFGMVVDGAVVMVENIVRHLGHQEHAGRSVADRIRAAAHEVQRPVFYAIIIIITGYLPIFTLQRVEGRLFSPMAWTVAFALLGAVIFSMTIAPVLCSFLFRREVREWENPLLVWITGLYRHAVTWTVHHRWVMVGVSIMAVCLSVYLVFGKNGEVIGSEFLPHLDEGSLWVRGTLAPSTGPTEGIRLMNQARLVLCSFPEATECTSQTGRPDDGTDTTGFFNTEYFVGLKPKEQWRPGFHQNKEELIAAMDQELEKIPGVVWGFSQPIADNVEEAVSGVKGQLATKIYGEDLRVLEDKGGRDRQSDARRSRHRRSRRLPRCWASRTSTSWWTAPRRRAIRSTWPTCRTPSRPRWAATPSPRCCRAKPATTWSSATCRSTAIPRRPSSRSACSRPPANAFRWPSSARSRKTRRRLGNLPRRQ